jgi:hypothetical protein
MLGPEVLKLGGVGSSFRREMNQLDGTVEATVVIRRDISNEVGRVTVADFSASDFENWQR